MTEFESFLSPDHPIRQGDIFAWGNWKERTVWDQFGVVITADCDIANGKIGGFLTYLPILPLAAYVKQVWARARIDGMFRTHERQLSDELHRIHANINPNAIKLDTARLRQWVLESTNEGILDSLSVTHESEIKHIVASLDVYRDLYELSTAENGSILIDQYCEIRAVRHSMSIERVRSAVARDIHADVVRNLPLDCFFLTSLPQVDELGFVVMLRHIQPIRQETLTVSYQDAKGADSKAYRLGRLSPTFKYAVSQKFGSLFSRIGLPSEYEEWQDTIAAELSQSLVARKAGEA